MKNVLVFVQAKGVCNFRNTTRTAQVDAGKWGEYLGVSNSRGVAERTAQAGTAEWREYLTPAEWLLLRRLTGRLPIWLN